MYYALRDTHNVTRAYADDSGFKDENGDLAIFPVGWRIVELKRKPTDSSVMRVIARRSRYHGDLKAPGSKLAWGK